MSNINLTSQQQVVLEEAIKFWNDPNQQIFQYCGFPGTGKTFILKEIIKAIGVNPERVAPMAYIGQAAINLRMNGFHNARTIHSWVYKAINDLEYDENGNIVYDETFGVPKYKPRFVYNGDAFNNIDLIVIDEAGSVPLSLKADIERAGIKIIATGDLGQLPPPCDKPAYLKSGVIHKLTKIMRQEDTENNGILELARDVSNGRKVRMGPYGNNVYVINESNLTNKMLAEAEVVICATNRTRDYYNKYIRENVFNRKSSMPLKGDILVSRENNWLLDSGGISLANGLRCRVLEDSCITDFDCDTYSVDFQLINLPTTTFNNIRGDFVYLNSPHENRLKLKNRKYSTGHKFEYGYCITAHMAQGSQYDSGIVIAEWFGDLTAKLNFTAITRFRKKLIYVIKNFERRY